jgi:hypothetical protein
MASRVTAEPPHLVQATRTSPGLKRHHKAMIVAGILFIALCVLGIIYIRVLPFSEKAILEDLAEASDSEVTVQGYHRTHFPSPGCVLERVEFRKGKDRFLLISINKLVIKGTFLGLLHHHVHHINAIGAHVFIPPFGSDITFQTKHSNMVVEELVANGTLVEFAAEAPSGKPLIFDVHEGLLTDIRWDKPIRYRLKFRNPDPPGEISATGDFGPWVHGHADETPFSGDYSFEQANLGVYGGIGGILSSKGSFQGKLGHINVSGTTETPDFEVKTSGHKVNLATRFQGYVDGTRGDTYLDNIEARFGRTTLIAKGSVAGSKDHRGKFTQFQISSQRARVEDLLGLFVSAPRSPMSGDVSVTTRAQLPSGDEEFLKRVRLDGGFSIKQGTFSNDETQTDVDKLSAGARGKNKDDPADVVSDLTGTVQVVGGTAHFSALSFSIPGAKADMHGAYDLPSHKVNLHGQMRVDTQISNTTTGFKSFVLKFMEPFFKKKKKGEIVPVHILGTYEKPDIGLDFNQSSEKDKKKSGK